MDAWWWQFLTLQFDPIAFSVGFFSVSWYALCYILGASVALTLLFRRRSLILPPEDFWSLVTSILWGVLIGARLGYIALYGDHVFWAEPWRIFSPYDFTTGLWVGIRGMSFFGGLIGGSLGLLLFTYRRKLSFWKLADHIVLFVPIALFFGRLGNFFNHELIGRETSVSWGMFFPGGGGGLRHPSQLYEACGEGLLLFLLLWWLAKRAHFPGFLTSIFLIGYGGIRLFLEGFREPDQGAIPLWGGLFLNEWLNVGLGVLGIGILFFLSWAWYNREELKKL